MYLINLISLVKQFLCVWLLFFRLERIPDHDFSHAEEFVRVMKILYTSTFCVSSERTPAWGHILPILQKLEGHFKVQDADSTCTAAIKKRVWDDLSKHYTVCILLLQFVVNP